MYHLIMLIAGMAYQLLLSVKVSSDKISVIGFGQILALNIGYILVIFPDISVKHRYIGNV